MLGKGSLPGTTELQLEGTLLLWSDSQPDPCPAPPLTNPVTSAQVHLTDMWLATSYWLSDSSWPVASCMWPPTLA